MDGAQLTLSPTLSREGRGGYCYRNEIFKIRKKSRDGTPSAETYNLAIGCRNGHRSLAPPPVRRHPNHRASHPCTFGDNSSMDLTPLLSI
jgi:hypothetical protein